MAEYQGSCHCGAVTFTFSHDEAIEKGLRCNCSICERKGAIMSSFVLAPDELKIKADEGALSLYQFDSKVAKHYFCNKCGIYTFHETVRMPGHFRVNLGCVDSVNSVELPFDIFDGASL